jgi:hypothetical protein
VIPGSVLYGEHRKQPSAEKVRVLAACRNRIPAGARGFEGRFVVIVDLLLKLSPRGHAQDFIEPGRLRRANWRHLGNLRSDKIVGAEKISSSVKSDREKA